MGGNREEAGATQGPVHTAAQAEDITARPPEALFFLPLSSENKGDKGGGGGSGEEEWGTGRKIEFVRVVCACVCE